MMLCANEGLKYRALSPRRDGGLRQPRICPLIRII